MTSKKVFLLVVLFLIVAISLLFIFPEIMQSLINGYVLGFMSFQLLCVLKDFIPQKSFNLDDMLITCKVCRKKRAARDIDVHKTPIKGLEDDFPHCCENIQYCNDNLSCYHGARTPRVYNK